MVDAVVVTGPLDYDPGGARPLTQTEDGSLRVIAKGGRTSEATFTPAAEAYTAGDVIAVAQEFQDIGPESGGEVLITGAALRVDHTAVISGETSYRLHLYSVTPPSALANNAAWDLPSGDRAAYRGYIDLGTPVDMGSTLWVETQGINKQVTVPAGGSLFGYLVTNGGFTATAAARLVRLKGVDL